MLTKMPPRSSLIRFAENTSFDAEDARYYLIQFLITGRLASEYLIDGEGREITEDWSDVRESTSYLEGLVHPYNHLKSVEDSILIEKLNKESTNILPKK